MSADEIVRGNLLAVARPLSLGERMRYRSIWSRLRDENAPLRVLSYGELVSAPVSHFDALLLSIATPEWRKMALILGHALAEAWDDDIAQIGDSFFAARFARWRKWGSSNSEATSRRGGQPKCAAHRHPRNPSSLHRMRSERW